MSWNDNGLTIFLGRDAIQLDSTIILAILMAVLALCFTAYALAPGRQSACKWRRVRENSRTPFTKWRCRDCVMEAFTTDRRPPKECKRVLRSTL